MKSRRIAELRHALRRWRRTLKMRLPYVRRREYSKVFQKYSMLTRELSAGLRGASDADYTIVKPWSARIGGDACLFLGHQVKPRLKHHVRHHLDSLLDAGLQVVLIVNTSLPHNEIIVERDLLDRLSAVIIRDNLGYDFAGWAHVFGLIGDSLDADRLFLINDSIVGPLDESSFKRLVDKVRSTDADVVGLTESLTPTPHLQSFFLVFTRGAMPFARQFMSEVLCFRDKSTVIDVYETNLTERARVAGLACTPVFPALSNDPYASNDTYFRWSELIELGFPYLKASVLGEHAALGEMQERVPAQILQAFLDDQNEGTVLAR